MKIPAEYQGLSKSALIRAYKNDNPEEKPKQISEAISVWLGEEVEPQYISTILSQAKKKAEKEALRNGSQGTIFKDTDKPAKSVATTDTGTTETATEWSNDSIVSGGSDPRGLLLVIQAAELVGLSGVRRILESLENLKK